MQCISGAEPLVYLTKIIQGLVVSVCVCCSAMYIGGSASGVSDHDYLSAGGKCVCAAVECLLGAEQSPLCF